MRKHRPRWFYAAAYILGGVLLGLAVVLVLRSGISLDTLVTFPSKNPLLAAGLLLLCYGLKSATIFFPLLLLEMAAGYLFPTITALVINSLGIWIVLTIPYWIGRALGLRQVSKLTQKYPKFQTIMEKQQNHSLFLCFFLRAISCLPGDLVTMYLGATHTPFFHNLLGGTLGILPGMILATFMGLSIQDPSSPAFWISAALSVGLAVLSTLLYYIYLKRQKGKEGHV
ncbi:MAG: TVP38/TMEM64 family protein [Oscillospiraceae bacterium]|mgnify:CR=1 FL=1|nr:TVP38/TMEM64 family protein [Oscillospiraceae bacterium]